MMLILPLHLPLRRVIVSRRRRDGAAAATVEEVAAHVDAVVVVSVDGRRLRLMSMLLSPPTSYAPLLLTILI